MDVQELGYEHYPPVTRMSNCGSAVTASTTAAEAEAMIEVAEASMPEWHRPSPCCCRGFQCCMSQRQSNHRRLKPAPLQALCRRMCQVVAFATCAAAYPQTKAGTRVLDWCAVTAPLSCREGWPAAGILCKSHEMPQCVEASCWPAAYCVA